MDGALHLRLCATARDWRLFERLPEILYGSDPAYVPPFPGDVAKLRSPTHPFHRDGELKAYLALRHGEPVGRIGSVVNRTHNRLHGDRTGFFGFFDFADDAVGAALLERARVDLRAAGLEAMRGPFNPTQNDECGVLVAGDRGAPYFGMPYTPPGRDEAYQRLGLTPAHDMFAYDLPRQLEGAFESRFGGLVERIRQRVPITVRPVDLRRMDEEAELVSRLFNDALAAEWNFMPLSKEMTLFFAKDLLREIESEAILIAEVHGKPAGLSIGLPDLNEFLLDAKRLPRWLRWPRLIWLIKTRRCRRMRWAVFAMLPEYRKKGGTLLLVYEAVNRMKDRYGTGEISWTQDHNTEVNALAAQMGLEVYRRYRIYEAAL